MERKTRLSFDELVMMNNTVSELPNCFLLNEIGLILVNGEKGREEAEKFLRELLDTNDWKDRFYAFCFLLSTNNLSQETIIRLEKFKEESANKEILPLAEESIEHFKGMDSNISQ